MPYTAEISRTSPSCFVFMIDQSDSMADLWGGGEGTSRKSEGVADAINRLLQNLVIRCSKEEGIRDYYHVSVIGYGRDVGPALGSSLAQEGRDAAPAPGKRRFAGPASGEAPEEGEGAGPPLSAAAQAGSAGPLEGRDLVPISEIGDNPMRLETRRRREDDGSGGTVERNARFPVWFDPRASNGTPMCQALTQAQAVVYRFLGDNPRCFPPIIINITDGEATDGDPRNIAKILRDMKSDDGNVLVFNLHISSAAGEPVLFPNSAKGLPDDYARLLFEMSSELPEYMRSFALQDGYSVDPGARGFVFNGDIASVISFLDIGTRPGNLR